MDTRAVEKSQGCLSSGRDVEAEGAKEQQGRGADDAFSGGNERQKWRRKRIGSKGRMAI